MPAVELVGRTFALSMEVLVGVILTQLLKTTSGEKMAWPGFHGVVASKKLYHLAEPAHIGVLAPAERPRDAEVEVKGPRTTDARGQRSESQRGPESESGGPRLAGLGLELEDK